MLCQIKKYISASFFLVWNHLIYMWDDVCNISLLEDNQN